MTKEQFKAARKELGLTQKELSVELGFSEQQVRNIENGRRGIKQTVEMAMELLQIRASL